MARILPQSTFPSLLMFNHNDTIDTNGSSEAVREFNSTTPHQGRPGGDLFDAFNNPWNVISAATRKRFNHLFDYVYILFVIVGVPSNVINCIVFYRQVCIGD